jgi:hypothetical protein
MVEYRYVDGEGIIEVNVDEGSFMEYAPELEFVYDYAEDGLYVYLEKRDNKKAKDLFVEYFQDKIDDIKDSEFEEEVDFE